VRVPYIDVDLRPAAAIVAISLVLVVVIRALERYAHTAAVRRTQAALRKATSERPENASD